MKKGADTTLHKIKGKLLGNLGVFVERGSAFLGVVRGSNTCKLYRAEDELATILVGMRCNE